MLQRWSTLKTKWTPALPSYTKASGVSGNLSSVGSDTLANLMTMWAEEYKRHYPNVNIQIQAAGSSTAPPALTEGTANIGPMSRKMKDDEIGAFEKKFGYKPTAIPVAIDALAVFVHKDNPIKGLTMQQVDAIFSSTRTCGAASEHHQLGPSRPDRRMGGRAICSCSVATRCPAPTATSRSTRCARVTSRPPSTSSRVRPRWCSRSPARSTRIGYSGIGYMTSSVRAVPLAKKGGEAFEANDENALAGKYPLARYLYVYVNKAPNKPLQPLEKEFLKMVLCKQGQEVVVKDGLHSAAARRWSTKR